MATEQLISDLLWDQATHKQAGGVVGLDLSLTSAGLAYIDVEGDLTEFSSIGEAGSKGATLYEREERITRSVTGIVEWVLTDVQPVLAVVEAPSFGSQGGSAFDRAGLWWGVVRQLREFDIEVAQVAPRTRAKYGTGDGNANKKVVMAHVEHRYGDQLPFALPKVSHGRDDVCDAIILAAMGARFLGMPIEQDDMPLANLEAMNAVKWPVSL